VTLGVFQVVAIMGAHTLGGARLAYSGYTGVWTPGEKLENMLEPVIKPT